MGNPNGPYSVSKEKVKKPPATPSVISLPPMVKPAQYPTQDVPVYLIVRSETNRVPMVDDDFVERIRAGVNSPVLLRPIKATMEDARAHAESWQRIDTPAVVIGQTIYKLVYGERRWLAAQRAGHTHIPAIIRDLTDSEALKIQVRENEDREDYKPMERAAAYGHLRDQYMKDHAGEKGFTEEKCYALIAADLPNKIKGRTVQQIIALGKLHKFCQDALNQGEMEASHGYEICRRSEEEQLTLLAWLRKETQHGQGDIPSVRRLKLEIRNIDVRADEKRWQQGLVKGEKETALSVKFNVEFDGKKIDLVPGATLPVSVQSKLIKAYPGLTTAHFLKDCRVQLAIGLNGKPFYLTVKELQNVLTTGIPCATDASPQTSAPDFFRNDDKLGDPKLHGSAKPLTAAQIKKIAEKVERESREFKRQQDSFEREERIKKVYRGLFFAALAKKAQITSRLLAHVIPAMVFEIWERGLPIETFAQQSLGWPAPVDGDTYAYWEVKKHSLKHTRKFTGGLLAAMVLTLYLNDAESLKLAKYMGVDPKRLRKQAAQQVAQEDLDNAADRFAAKAEPRAKGQKLKAGAQ